MSLKGGEALSPNIPSEVLANAMVDLRYYSFKGNFPENVSTESSEYQTFNVDNRNANVSNIEVNPYSTAYRDLKNSYILANYRIIDKNGDPADPTIDVPEPLQSLIHFKDIRTYFDSRKVSDDHDDIYPYQAFHKACLTERNVNTPTALLSVSSKALYEDIYDVGAGNLAVPAVNASLQWKTEYLSTLDPNNNGKDLVVKPQDGIWRQSAFIPSTTRRRS